MGIIERKQQSRDLISFVSEITFNISETNTVVKRKIARLSKIRSNSAAYRKHILNVNMCVNRNKQ